MQLVKESELKQHDPNFEPIHIVLESQEEVDLMYGIFSFTPLLDCFRNDIGNLVPKLFTKLCSIGTWNYHTYLQKMNSGLKRK